jgi:hypothetical protein
VDPVLPGNPVDDIAPRAALTLRPLVTYLIIFNVIIGFIIGMVLLAISGSLGAPAGVLVAALLVGAVVAVASWLRTSIQFTAGDLAVTMLLGPRRIPWARVNRVTLEDIHDSDSGEVTHRRAVVTYRRDPGSPLPPMPTVLGEYRTWALAHFRRVSLPLFFPVPADQPTPGAGTRQRRTWIGRRADRQRQIIREEFAARGYPLPE